MYSLFEVFLKIVQMTKKQYLEFFFVFLPLSLSTYSARDGKRIEKRQKNK